MTRAAKKKAPFVCPVIYSQASIFPGPCGTTGLSKAKHMANHKGPKELYKFHPRYHSPKPKPKPKVKAKAKKPSRKKWTGWGVIGNDNGLYGHGEWIYVTCETRKVARIQARRKNAEKDQTYTYRVSKIGEL